MPTFSDGAWKRRTGGDRTQEDKMQTLFILALCAIALGGSLIKGATFGLYTDYQPKRHEDEAPSAQGVGDRLEANVAFYEFSEFDSDLSI
ncbi:MAG: hypothetical protein ACOX0A_08345 [Thermoguttaceae bacterium]|jgi:hypothetical protein